MRPTLPILGVLLGFVVQASAPADIINVPGDQPTIQAGIDAAVNGDEVVVADGVYTGPGNRDLDIAGKPITVRSANGPKNCIIDCQGIPHRGFYFDSGETSDTIVEGFTITNGHATDQSPGGASGGAIYCLNSSPKLINCLVTSSLAEQGGGVYCESSAPAIFGSTLQGNAAMKGGGMYAWMSSEPSLTGCIVTGNNASATGGGAWYSHNTTATLVDCEISHNVAEIHGAGIYSTLNTDLTLTDCSILENTAHGKSGAGFGGGVTHTSDLGSAGDLTMTNCLLFGNISFHGAGVLVGGGAASISGCVFTNNTAGDHGFASGGGLRFDGGTGDSLVLSNCSFIDNEAFAGGGLEISGRNAAVDECLFDGNTAVQGGGLKIRLGTEGPATLSNLVIRNNIATLGGGMYTTQQTVPTLVNSVFTGNSATSHGGGVYNTGNSFPTFINGTLSGNNSPAGGGIYNSGGSCSVANSIIWGNPGGAILGDIALASHSLIEGGYIGELIMTEDPLFVDADGPDNTPGTEDDDLRLRACSAAIDSGTNDVLPQDITTDLDGNPRIVDGDYDDVAVVDIGAYEFQADSVCCPADFDGDGTVDAFDLAELLGDWGPCPEPPEPCPADLFGTGDGFVSAEDLAVLLGAWGLCE